MRPYDQGYLDGTDDALYDTVFDTDLLIQLGCTISYIHGYEAGVASIYELA